MPEFASAAPDHRADVMVRLDRVTHHFSSGDAAGGAPALDELSFVVPKGRITVLLGPNGAGKTTAFRAVTGALVPDSGTVRTFGLDPDDEGHLVRPRCGVVSAKPALYDRLSGRDNLEYSAHLHGVRGDLTPRVDAAARRFGILDALDKQVGGYSTGMKTRLALARAVLHEPELLLFDEPTSGLDPESSHAVLELIRDMTRDGHTVVMCTHLLAEAEGLADHIVMMEAGRAVAEGSPGELTGDLWPHPVLELDAVDPRVLDRLAAYDGVVAYRRDPGGARLELDSLDRVPDIVSALCADGAAITRVDPQMPTLEDLYFTLRRQVAAQHATTTPSATDRLDPIEARPAVPRVPPRQSEQSPLHTPVPSDASALADSTVEGPPEHGTNSDAGARR